MPVGLLRESSKYTRAVIPCLSGAQTFGPEKTSEKFSFAKPVYFISVEKVVKPPPGLTPSSPESLSGLVKQISTASSSSYSLWMVG